MSYPTESRKHMTVREEIAARFAAALLARRGFSSDATNEGITLADKLLLELKKPIAVTEDPRIAKLQASLREALKHATEYYTGCMYCGKNVAIVDGEAQPHDCWHQRAKELCDGT